MQRGTVSLMHSVLAGAMLLWFALVAQRIEQEPSNLLVAGSIPAEGTKYGPTRQRRAFRGLSRSQAAPHRSELCERGVGHLVC